MKDSMLGKVFALCTDEEQAAFLNEAGRALSRVCDTENLREMQLLRIADYLDTHGRKLVRQLAEFTKPEQP